MTDYKQDIEEILEKLHEKLLIGWIVNDGKPHPMPSHASNDGCTDEATQALTHLIETEKIAELRLIEKAQQDYDEWSGFCMDDTSDFGNYITQRISELQSRGEV